MTAEAGRLAYVDTSEIRVTIELTSTIGFDKEDKSPNECAFADAGVVRSRFRSKTIPKQRTKCGRTYSSSTRTYMFYSRA